MDLRTDRGVRWKNDELGFHDEQLYCLSYHFLDEPIRVSLKDGREGYLVGYVPEHYPDAKDQIYQPERLLFVPLGCTEIRSVSKKKYEEQLLR